MKKKIITDISFLKQRSEEIPSQGIESEPCEEIEEIIKDLEDSLDLTRGTGLTAIQIGIIKRVAIIRRGKTKLNLFNPKIIKKEDRFKYVGERCLSLPGLAIDTARYMHVVIENGNEKKYSLDGMEAVCVLHEIDHMNGRLITDAKWRKKNR